MDIPPSNRERARGQDALLAPDRCRPCRQNELDTHALLCWLAEPDRLSEAADAAMADQTARVVVSAASGWEIATKVSLDPALQPFPGQVLW